MGKWYSTIIYSSSD